MILFKRGTCRGISEHSVDEKGDGSGDWYVVFEREARDGVEESITLSFMDLSVLEQHSNPQQQVRKVTS